MAGFTPAIASSLLQNFALVTAALGLGGSPVGRAWDHDLERLLLLDPEYEVALTAFAMGWPTPEPERPLERLRERVPVSDDDVHGMAPDPE